MLVNSAGPRNLVIRPEVEHDLALLRRSLRLGVARRRYTAQSALAAYHDALAQVLQRDETFIADDEADVIRVRCRSCGYPQAMQVADEDNPTRRYACRCSPGTPRDGYMDAIDRTGGYRVDATEILTSPT